MIHRIWYIDDDITFLINDKVRLNLLENVMCLKTQQEYLVVVLIVANPIIGKSARVWIYNTRSGDLTFTVVFVFSQFFIEDRFYLLV